MQIQPWMIHPTIIGIMEVLLGFSLVFPTVIRMIPPLNEKFMKLKSKDQILFLRKCVSIVHCWFVTGIVFYLHWNPQHCETHWQMFSELWVGFLMTDLILSLLTGTSTADDRNHHILYSVVHGLVMYTGAGCLAFRVLSLRYYADLFNQNMQLRLLLAMTGFKDTKLYRINTVIASAGFFCVRILVIPFAWYHFWINRIELYEFTMSSYLYYGTIGLFVLSDLQNIDWNKRLYQSAVRAMKQNKKD